jgi:tryptophan-rich sensory protein
MSNSPPSPKPPGRQLAALVAWLALCFLASAGAVFVSTGDWYAGLHKPSWNPPPWIFGPVWTLLYIMMAVAAWMVWRAGGWRAQGRALGFFLLQWLLNAVWTPLFFGLHRPLLAFAEIMALLLTLLITTVLFWRVRKIAGFLLLPYLAWVSFAAFLNFTLWQLNH